MPVLEARSVGRMSMYNYSQTANVIASPDNRKTGNAFFRTISHTADMDDDDDKNGGPNHLREWMRFRDLNGAKLASELKITPGMVSDLANSRRALSAKWLRRLAPVLRTTPGLLLDHNPFDLPNDIIEIWVNADATQRRQLTEVARALVRREAGG